jgi:hypothetical protein
MSQEYLFVTTNTTEVTDGLKEVLQTPTGQRYKQDFYTPEDGDQHLGQILAAAQRLSGGPEISVQHMERALRLLLDAGDIPPRDPEVPEELAEPVEVVDERPRDKNGKLLSPQHIQWAEYRRFSESASTKDVAERKRTDAGYAAYVKKQLAAEMNQPIDGAVTPAGQSTLPKPKYASDDPELIRFARAYITEPTTNLKPRGGFVTIAGQPMSWTRYNELLNKAIAARLIA